MAKSLILLTAAAIICRSVLAQRACPRVRCRTRRYCGRLGFKVDSNGCRTCECNDYGRVTTTTLAPSTRPPTFCDFPIGFCDSVPCEWGIEPDPPQTCITHCFCLTPLTRTGTRRLCTVPERICTDVADTCKYGLATEPAGVCDPGCHCREFPNCPRVSVATCERKCGVRGFTTTEVDLCPTCTCNPHPHPKPGICPNISPGVPTDNYNCNGDDSKCPGQWKCCFDTNRVHICEPPPPNTLPGWPRYKPGECPRIDITFPPDTKNCEGRDTVCLGSQKCCKDLSNVWVCVDPVNNPYE